MNPQNPLDPGNQMAPFEPVGWYNRRSIVGRMLPALVVFAAVVALGLGALQAANQACACTPTPPVLPDSPIEGVVVAVDSTSLVDVSAFTLSVPEGWTYRLALGTLENATEFSPSHLTEHMASSEPVRAFYRLEAGSPVVYRVEDAPPPSPSPGPS